LAPANYRSFADASTTYDDVTAAVNSSSSASTATNNHNHNSTLTPVTTATADHDANYRGFSTSIYDMFSSTDAERTDCCALTCCGVLQSDRDRYLLQGVAPPSPFKRCSVHVVFPLLIFVMAGVAALHISERNLNQAVSTVLVLSLGAYFVLQCYKGRTKRIDIRKGLLWTKYQLAQHSNNSSNNRRSSRGQNISYVLEQDRPDDRDEQQEYYLGQAQSDFGCAHPCCLLACYPEDRAVGMDYLEHRDDNFCSLLWASLVSPVCGVHPQLLGLCAIAQEAREVESVLLPASYRRVDYITMQAVMDYYPAIYRAKCQDVMVSTTDAAAAAAPSSESVQSYTASSRWHLPPLSRLSTRLLQSLAAFFALMLVWGFAGPYYWTYIVQIVVQHASFGWMDYLVFCATWLQAVGLLYLLTRMGNHFKNSQLSTDAIIKFFASGFCLSTSLAIFWEMIVSLVLRSAVSLSLVIAGVDVATNPDGYNLGAAGFASTSVTAPFLADTTGSRKDFIKTFGNSHPVFYTLYLFIEAFFMAALVEELCKYFGYRMVEHPDFFSKQDLEETTRVVYGDTEEEIEQARRQRRERPSYANQNDSMQAQGAAITIAMIAVAVGFTCCENLVYIFIYNGSSVEMELWVLAVRSCFPVHAVTAAIQSGGVCERDLELSRTTKLGRIIWPAVLFHGGYDFLLLWIDFMAARKGVDENDDVDALESSSALVLFLAFGISVFAMLLALAFYFRMARRQRNRLIAMDRQESATRSRLI
jgi:RsiW-degrading membrane proteinase PrsW (M82 family)